MLFSHKPYDFEVIYRPVFELRIAMIWTCSACIIEILSFINNLPAGIAHVQSMLCLFMMLIFSIKGYSILKMQNKLLGFKQEFISLDRFVEETARYRQENTVWLGKGFQWSPVQTQRIHEILKTNYGDIANHLRFNDRIRYHLSCFKKALFPKRKKSGDLFVLRLCRACYCLLCPPPYRSKDMGCRFIHGLSDNEEDIAIPLDYFKGHCLIIGTTGSGKTRLAELLNTQAIMRGECLIIIDPKGDKELKENARKACDAYRQYCIKNSLPDPGKRFYSFHPAFPDESVHLNLLANIARDTDVASRITNLTPSKDGGLDPFTAFGWLSINTISQALLLLGINPSLEEIKNHLLDSMQKLTSKAVEEFCKLSDQNRRKTDGEIEFTYERCYDSYAIAARNLGKLNILGRRIEWLAKHDIPFEAQTLIKCQVFQDHYLNEPNASTISSLVKLYQHPKEHFAKMINNMLPILEMLSSGTLSTMLSMSNEKEHDRNHAEQINTLDIIRQKAVLYVGLDSLSDGIVGSAIGSLLLSDLTAAAGQIYNFMEGDIAPINVFVDEAAECLNEPCIRLLNKGRGASYRLIVATQTISDFVSRLGSKDKAAMVLGNVNNSIALRTRDPQSQKYLSEDLPETYIKERSLSQGQNSLVTNPIEHGGTQSEQLKNTRTALLAPQFFNLLPNCEYIANFAGGKVIKGRLPIIGTDRSKEIKRTVVPSVTDDETVENLNKRLRA